MLKRKRRDREKVENGGNAEDYCFVCKDGGLLMVCDHKECVKAYHPQCVGREESTEDVEEQWICDWHYCLICRKNSRFQCFCCPNAVCLSCFKDALFAKVKGNKGFCNDCLKLALLEEEGMEVDSDGEKVDFNDRETYEGLFKEYFDIIKGKEGLMLKDLHYANVQMKKGENCRSMFLKSHQSEQLPLDSDKSIKEEEDKEFLAIKHDNDDGKQKIIAYKKEPKKMPRRRKGPKRIEFASWASKPLIEFLASIQEDTGKKLSQDDVASIVSDYAHEKKLLHPDKKKLILCDIRLRSLLGRNSIRLYQVKNALKPHFADQSEDEGYSLGYDKDKVTLHGKNLAGRKKLKSFQHKISLLDKFQTKKSILDKPNKPEVVGQVIYSPYATIGLQNMKLVYLKKCLVEKLLEQRESFESKVVGSFVKVKSEPFDARHPYQLLSVIGVQHFGDGNEKVRLQLSNLPNDVPLCLLSNDDLSEQDCEELRQKFDNNFLSKPTVAALEKKAKDLHEDLTKHWITTELSILRNRIDLANEKGRRAKLFEYYRKRDLLQSEAEHARLLNEVPKVLADIIEVKPESDEDNSSPGKNQAWETKIGSIQHKGLLSEKFRLKESILDEPNKTDCVVKAICSRYGTIGPQNMKLVYLKKCLVEKLLEQRESFESKVVGSFVKVRSNPFDARHPCQLLPVVGVQNFGEGNEKVHLQVSNLPNNIPIHLLSNEDISEQDCEELRQKVDNGLISKPTVVALEKKAKDLHEDLTRHWITIELSILRNRIDVANEKGQKAKLFEYRRKKDLLESEAEQARLLNEVPKVLADVIELNPESEEYSSGYDKDNVSLKPHFAENIDQSKDEVYNLGYDEDNIPLPAEKQAWRRKVGSIQHNGSLLEKLQQKETISDKPNQTKLVVEDICSRYATIGPQNMKLVYLKKCFVEKLLENRESFESKVVGSFVKVKSDPFDVRHPYQLLPVIGVKNSGDGNEKVLLQVSNLASDVPMRLLSNDDISEQDCEELRQKVDNGLISKPTVEALEKKVKDLHEDMTKHWITMELSILRNRIDLANEKGQRAKMFEYHRKRELLQSQAEQARLLNEIPKVLADVIKVEPESEKTRQYDISETVRSHVNHGENSDGNGSKQEELVILHIRQC